MKKISILMTLFIASAFAHAEYWTCSTTCSTIESYSIASIGPLSTNSAITDLHGYCQIEGGRVSSPGGPSCNSYRCIKRAVSSSQVSGSGFTYSEAAQSTRRNCEAGNTALSNVCSEYKSSSTSTLNCEKY